MCLARATDVWADSPGLAHPWGHLQDPESLTHLHVSQTKHLHTPDLLGKSCWLTLTEYEQSLSLDTETQGALFSFPHQYVQKLSSINMYCFVIIF